MTAHTPASRRRYWLLSVALVRFGRTPDGTRTRWLRAHPFTWRERRAVMQRHKGFR